MRGYELWDTASGNLLDDFDTEASALSAVHEWLDREGASATGSLSLVSVDDQGKPHEVASGHDLAALARRVVTADPPTETARKLRRTTQRSR